MGHQPDPNAGPAGDDPDPQPPVCGRSPAPPPSPDSPAPPSSSDSSDSKASAGALGPADAPASADAPSPLEAQTAPDAQPGEGTQPGGEPRASLLAGFDRGGTWDTRPPGPDLAVALAAAAGPEWRCKGASGEQTIGILGRITALESGMAAGKLGVTRTLIRDDDPAFLCGSRHGHLPDLWERALAAEIALALGASVPSADKTMRAAWELGARLPEISTSWRRGSSTRRRRGWSRRSSPS